MSPHPCLTNFSGTKDLLVLLHHTANLLNPGRCCPPMVMEDQHQQAIFFFPQMQLLSSQMLCPLKLCWGLEHLENIMVPQCSQMIHSSTTTTTLLTLNSADSEIQHAFQKPPRNLIRSREAAHNLSMALKTPRCKWKAPLVSFGGPC